MFAPVFEDLPPHIKIKESTRARRLALRLDTHERLFHLVIPRGVSLRKALRFAEEHEDWMQEQLSELPEPIPLGNGAVVPVLGQNRTLKISYDSTLKRTSISMIEKEIFVKTNLDDPKPRIVRFLRKQAKEALSMMAQEKAVQIDRKINSISVKDTKSRWGSCSEDNNLSFSWRLILAPFEAIDYVVAHEVAHLVHLDHSKAFWNLCRELSEDYMEGKYWMDNHGKELMRWG